MSKMTATKKAMTTTSPPRVPAELTLAHWRTPQRIVRLDASLADGVPRNLADPMQIADMPDEMVGYDCIFATEDPWMLRLWSYDRDKREYGARWTALRLRINPRTVSAQLKTPAGVGAFWNHFTYGGNALGRVADLRAESKQLRGGMMISGLALAGWGTSHAQIDAGMNRGLSAGLRLIDEPKMKRAEGEGGGTFDKPDSLTYGRVRVVEVSLTATPMIAQAGITGRRSTED